LAQGEQPRREEPAGSSKRRAGGPRDRSRIPPQRRGAATRAGDHRGDSHAVLDRIERGAQPDTIATALARDAQNGDDLAFAELYVRFFDRVHRYLLIALKNPDDAQEVAQDVFARALAGLDGFDPDRGEFRDWLFSMVRSVAIDHLRKGSRAEEVELNALPSNALPVADRAASLIDRLDPEEGFRSLIDELPEAQRRVLAMRFVFGLSTLEICDVLDSSPDAIRHVQHRALKALASEMERRQLAA
jgi:RNA polymerase sigma-70 factor (ECF subfamily)